MNTQTQASHTLLLNLPRAHRRRASERGTFFRIERCVLSFFNLSFSVPARLLTHASSSAAAAAVAASSSPPPTRLGTRVSPLIMTIDMYYDGQHSTSLACAVRDTRQSASTRLHRPHGHGDGQSLKRITGTACLELPPQAVSQRPTRPARVAAIIYSLTCSSQRGSIVAGQDRTGQGRNSVGWHLFQFFAGHLNASRQYLVLL